MSLLDRLFGKRPDERDALRPVWDRVVAIARKPGWYVPLGVADSMEGRFDMVTLVLAAVLLRMERDPAMAGATARLTELFVDDMDGQLRQSGIGDPTVGKHVRKLVTTLGGRLGALREALPLGEAALIPVLERNLTTLPDADMAALAGAVTGMAGTIGETGAEDLLAGHFAFDPA